MRIELENRLIDFSVTVHKMVVGLKRNILSLNLSNQIIRSSTSAALNFGEAQGAQSRNDFIHKNSIVLKELRETEICLKIILKSGISNNHLEVENLISECRQLVAIFQKTLNTLRSKK